MRFPLTLTSKIAAYIIGHKLRGTQKFATVLQLEPLHTCNLTCTGCGRIREYSTSLKDLLPLEDCLAAAAARRAHGRVFTAYDDNPCDLVEAEGMLRRS